jgi:hypothetical protein
MTYNRMEAKLIAGEHCRFCGDARAALVKTPCADQWICCDTAFVSFRGGGDVKWSMNALACAMPTIRISMEGRGKGVRNAVISGHPDMTNSMRRTPSTGPGIERGETLS